MLVPLAIMLIASCSNERAILGPESPAIEEIKPPVIEKLSKWLIYDIVPQLLLTHPELNAYSIDITIFTPILKLEKHTYRVQGYGTRNSNPTWSFGFTIKIIWNGEKPKNPDNWSVDYINLWTIYNEKK